MQLLEAAITILLILTTLHQVVQVEDNADDLANWNSHGACKDDVFIKQYKDCDAKLKRQLNRTQDIRLQCEMGFNFTLCTIDAACVLCNATKSRDFEDTLKDAWARGDEDFRQCTKWYSSYEYAHKRRCRVPVVVWVAVLTFTVPAIGLLGCCLVGVYCYCCKKRQTILFGASDDGQPKMGVADV